MLKGTGRFEHQMGSGISLVEARRSMEPDEKREWEEGSNKDLNFKVDRDNIMISDI